MSAVEPSAGPRPRLLFVDDEPKILQALESVLRRQRARWEMRFAEGGEAALAMIAAEHFDVVVCDMRMPKVSGAVVLGEVKLRHPEATRIVLSGHSEVESVLRTVPVAHQFLSKPCEPELLVRVIERALELRRLVEAPRLRALIGGVDALPSTPTSYVKLLELLARPQVGAKEIAQIIEGEPGMTAKVLQLVNSSFFALSREVVDVGEGVALLGTETIRALVLIAGAFAFAESLEPSFVEAQRRHALAVGALARRIVLDPSHRERAFAAGLLHDLGRLLLWVRRPGELERTEEAARAAGVSLAETERQVLGVTHADVGAVLLRTWGLPFDVVEATALHHGPLPEDASPSLVAVYVANHLVAPAQQRALEPLDLEGLRRLGLERHLPAWQALATEAAS